MGKIKKFVKKPMGLLTTLFVVLLIFFVVVIKLMKGPSISIVAKKMQAHTEKLLPGNVRYTTQETLNTLTGETDNLTQSVADLKTQFQQIKKDSMTSQKTNATLVQKEIKALQQANSALKNTVTHAIQQMKTAHQSLNKQHSDRYEVGEGGFFTPQKTKNDFVWVGDLSHFQRASTNTALTRFDVSPTMSTHDSGDLLHLNNHRHQSNLSNANASPKNQLISMYTIPQNTWLTGVIAEQPLIGIVPVNGEVINPRTLSFVIQANNLAANNWHLPEVLKGIQGDAVCQGFFAIKRPAVTCNVASLTFIFHDGRIATVNALKDDKLGVVTDVYGNPQISGTLHSNLGYFLAGTTLFAGAQGYGNALSAAQVQTQIASGFSPNIATIIGNAKSYAAGQGLSAAAQAAEQWWVERMKSTFDYVEVPNWNPKTHQLLQLNVKITRPIAIDYKLNARKVMYDHQITTFYNNSLD